MNTVSEITSFLRNFFSQYAFNYDELDASLGIPIGAVTKMLNGYEDYSVAALIAVLDRFGYEIVIFDKSVLKQWMDATSKRNTPLTVKTGVQIALDRLGSATE